MSQLLYSHGIVIRDRLCYRLARWSHPKYVTGTISRWDSYENDRNAFANELELLAYIRPLIDMKLVNYQPRPYVASPDADHMYDTWTPSFIRPEALTAAREYEDNPSESMRVFDCLMEKLEYVSDIPGSGDLSLENEHERDVFKWMCGQSAIVRETDRAREANNLLSVSDITLPGIGDLSPRDVIALRSADGFGEFRLAITRALERAQALGVPDKDRRRIIREELADARRSASKTWKSSHLGEDRRKAFRDVVIGAVVGSELSPVTGPLAAALGATGIAARSTSGLLWSWLSAKKSRPQEEGLARCYGVFLG
jgi:hypothetical protein